MEHFDWTGWSDWVALETLDLKSVPDTPGAYVIATDKPINRAIGTDENGFLDVGESNGLKKRLSSFKRCAFQRDVTGHMAGWRYAFFNFKKHFSHTSLRVRWFSTKSKEKAYAVERKLMVEYLKAHCELPPLNYKFNWDEFEEMQLFFAAQAESAN